MEKLTSTVGLRLPEMVDIGGVIARYYDSLRILFIAI